MRLGILLLALAALLALAGCGGEKLETASPTAGPGSKTQRDSGGGAAQFRVEGGDNSVQEFGSEAGQAEFEEAAAALHGYLDARAARNWGDACAFLASSLSRGLGQISGRHRASCPAILATLIGKTSSGSLREAAAADVGSLRVEGDRGFLLYRGAGGAVFAIGVVEEEGRWKVASLAGTPIG